MASTLGGESRKKVRVHESLEELGSELAEYVADIAESSVKERGAFALALSGASLIAFMGKLSEDRYKKTVEWGKWYIFWADERVVPKHHSDSNYKLAKHHLLSKVPIMGSHVYSINDGVSGEEAASEYEFRLRQMVKSRVIAVSDVNDCPKFDLILLGMGSDGHVASLFPGHAALREHSAWITFLTDSPEPPPERMTFTLPVINSAAHVAVVAAGGAKADAARAAVCGVGPNCPCAPAAMVRPISGKLVFFLDKAAASKLDSFHSSISN